MATFIFAPHWSYTFCPRDYFIYQFCVWTAIGEGREMKVSDCCKLYNCLNCLWLRHEHIFFLDISSFLVVVQPHSILTVNMNTTKLRKVLQEKIWLLNEVKGILCRLTSAAKSKLCSCHLQPMTVQQQQKNGSENLPASSRKILPPMQAI